MASSIETGPVSPPTKPPEVIVKHVDAVEKSKRRRSSFLLPSVSPNEESNGLISTILSAAHNVIGSKNGASSESIVDSALDHKGKKLHLHTLFSHLSNTLVPADTASPASNFSDDRSFSAVSTSNVHFEPVHNSPIQSLGNGDLSLQHFERKNGKSRGKSPDATQVKGSPFITKSASPKLLVSGTQDSKVVRKKSVNGSIAESSTSETSIKTDSDGHTFHPSEFANTDLENTFSNSSFRPNTSSKKNREFHAVFREIPAEEQLLGDFSCALSREILVQGKMYLSQNYICFNSNILGWTTSLVIPIQEIIQIEKKSTAVLFPNGMVIRTLHQKYVFATFLSRDTTFNVITRVWHDALLENGDENPFRLRSNSTRGRTMATGQTSEHHEISDISDGDGYDESSDVDDEFSESNSDHELTFMSKSSRKKSKQRKRSASSNSENSLPSSATLPEDDAGQNDTQSGQEETPKKGGTFKGLSNPGPATHPPTEYDYKKESNDTQVLDHTFNAPLGVVYDILWGPNNSTFVKVLESLKNTDVTKDTITALSTNGQKEREYSYIKPLNAPIGPKQTKCNITETLIFHDLKKYVFVEQITKTPDVPLGNSFKIRTKQFLSWGPNNTTHISVFTSVEWSAKSWIKGAVEKGSLDGQKSSMKTLAEIIDDAISEGGSGDGKRKRRKSKSSAAKAETKPEAVAAPQAEPASLGGSVVSLLEKIGQLVPVSIPMVSDSMMGGIVALIASFIYTLVLLKFIGGGSSHALFNASSAFTKTVTIDSNKYYLMPSLEAYVKDTNMRKVAEEELWDWMASRAHGPESHRSGKTVNQVFADEDFAEIMRITKNRIDAVYRNLV